MREKGREASMTPHRSHRVQSGTMDVIFMRGAVTVTERDLLFRLERPAQIRDMLLGVYRRSCGDGKPFGRLLARQPRQRQCIAAKRRRSQNVRVEQVVCTCGSEASERPGQHTADGICTAVHPDAPHLLCNRLK
jgi:hypothetical protein